MPDIFHVASVARNVLSRSKAGGKEFLVLVRMLVLVLALVLTLVLVLVLVPLLVLLVVTRRADGHHPDSKSNTGSGKYRILRLATYWYYERTFLEF